MDEFNEMFKRATRAVEALASFIDGNENIKEYLIECGEWIEDYTPENNVVECLARYYIC